MIGGGYWVAAIDENGMQIYSGRGRDAVEIYLAADDCAAIFAELAKYHGRTSPAPAVRVADPVVAATTEVFKGVPMEAREASGALQVAISAETRKECSDLAKAAKLDKISYVAIIRELFGVETTAGLTAEQGDRLLYVLREASEIPF